MTAAVPLAPPWCSRGATANDKRGGGMSACLLLPGMRLFYWVCESSPLLINTGTNTGSPTCQPLQACVPLRQAWAVPAFPGEDPARGQDSRTRPTLYITICTREERERGPGLERRARGESTPYRPIPEMPRDRQARAHRVIWCHNLAFSPV